MTTDAPHPDRPGPAAGADVPVPLVAVPAHPVPPGRVMHWRTDAVAVPLPYLEALQRAGAEAAVLAPRPLDSAAAARLVARVDGLMLCGGGDVDPAAYGAPPHPALEAVDRVRDAFELALLHAALEAGLPVLAICRGEQVLNVALGGTLHQHITDTHPGHGVPGVEGGAVIHDLVIEPHSRVAEAMGTTRATCSSHHHQAIDRVAPGLRVTARAPDGMIEAVEPDAPGTGGAPDGDAWVVGVQWHPEDTAARDPAQQGLFDRFVAACVQRSMRPGSRNG